MPSRSCETAEPALAPCDPRAQRQRRAPARERWRAADPLRPSRVRSAGARLSLPCRKGRPRALRAFTLLELIVVLALVALIAGMVASGLGRSAVHQKREQSLLALHSELMRARVRAMQSAAPARLEVSWLDERARLAVPTFDVSAQQSLRITHPAAQPVTNDDEPASAVRTRTVEALGMVAFDRQGEAYEGLSVTFDSSGRTRERAWRFAVRRAPGAGRAASDPGAIEGADTLFTISFDPVSGAPALHGADKSPDFAGSPSSSGSVSP